MLIHMLIVDGVKYKLWTPKDETKEFHPLVRDNSKDIFGENTLYFDVKHTLKSASGIGSIPDAYVIGLSKPAEWFVIESELSFHSVYDHIVKQLTKFINGIENQNARTQILEILYDQIISDDVLKAIVKKTIGSEDIHHFLSQLFSKQPRIVIVIDKKLPEIEEACRILKYQTDIVEFKTYVREGAEDIRAHLFEPIWVTKKIPVPDKLRREELGARGRTSEITSQGNYTLPILESLIEMGGSGKMSDVLEKVLQKMRDKLTTKDYEKLPTGIGVRWKNKAQWERQRLKTEGYLKKDSPRGIWEITDEGRRYHGDLAHEH